MGLYNRVTPTASSAVINGTVGAVDTARLLGRALAPEPHLDLFRAQMACGLRDSLLRSAHRGTAFFSPLGILHPPNLGQVT